ncbi:MAG: DUF2281 domain-containing protein [Gracilimonas sp.]|nr:DUF2281 domain-containing protein [Gracilimonas sp.]
MDDLELYAKLVQLPKELKKEADDFVEFLKTKVTDEKATQKRKAGLAKRLIEMTDDFEEPLDDFKEYQRYKDMGDKNGKIQN